MPAAHDQSPGDDAETTGWAADNSRNLALYRSLVAEHGLTHRALNWGSAEGQRTRFDVLCAIGIEPHSSVLDIGCGTGDLCLHLRRQGFTGRYVGVDITPEMVAAALARGLDAEFLVADVLALDADRVAALSSDYVLSSGIFYLRRNAPQQFLEAMTRRMLELAGVGVAFNSLSAWADRPAEDGEFRADPLATLSHCRTLTPHVVLRHDYHPADFTIYMRRRAWGVAARTPAEARS